MTAEQVRAARAEGYAAGHGLTPSTPNPYAPEHLPAWHDRRTPAQKAADAPGERDALTLARVWLTGHAAGIAAYADERGLALPSQDQTD